MNPEFVLPILGELFAKSALITFAAVLLARAWRGATAAQRHLLWFVALATVMMLPFTRLVAPFWRIPVGQAKPATVVKMEPLAVPTVLGDLESPTENAAPLAPKHAPVDWRKILLGTWLSGAVLLLGYRLFGSWRLHRLMRRSTPVDDPRIRLLLSRTLSELHLHRRPEIRLSEECRVPITWGSLCPVMLLPKGALQWSDTWVLAALRHEAAHISRYDYLTRWFAQVACALYWPNPLVWLLARSLRVAQELAADDLVLRSGTPADEYASQLVDAARAITTHGFFVRQAVAMACPSTLEDRVRAIVDGQRDRRPLSRLAAACGSLILACALGLSTAAQLRSDEQKSASQTSATETKPTNPGGPQIEIEAKFVAIDLRKGESAEPPAEKPVIYTDPQFQVIIRALNQKKGVDLLSAPRIATHPDQHSVMEVVREMRTPTDWKKEDGIWKPTKLESKNVGITLEAEPRLTKDGNIEFHTVASVVEFLGFLDLDTGKTIHASRVGPADYLPTPVVPGHRSRGIYSERRKETTVTLKSGETFAIDDLLETADTKAFEKDGTQKRIMVFVSPRIIVPAPQTVTIAAPADTTVAITLDKVGNLRLNGEPLTLEALKTRLKELKAGASDGPNVVLRPAPELAYKEVMALLDTLQSADIKNIGLVNPASQDTAANPAILTGHNTLTFQNGTDAASGLNGTLTVNSATVTANGGTLEFVADGAKPATSGGKSANDLTVNGTGTLNITGGTLVLNDGRQTASGSTLVTSGQLNIAGGDTDAEFLRRIYLEMAGRQPNPEEVRAFLDDPRPSTEKRKAVTDKLTASKNGASGAKPAAAQANTALFTREWKIPTNLIPAPDGSGPGNTREWLISRGIVFDGGAAATVPQPGRLIVRNTQAQLDLVDQLVSTAWSEPHAAPPAAGDNGVKAVVVAESPVQSKAEKIIIPKVELREATFAEAIDFLRAKAKELDPDKTGINIVVKPGTNPEVHITLSLTNVPLSEALRYVASLADLQIKFEKNAVLIGAPASASASQPEVKAAAAAPVPEPEKPVEITADKTRMENGVAIAEGHARLAFGKYDVGADTIRYHPDTRAADLIGHAEVKDGTNVIVGGEIGITFSSGSIRVLGSHR